MEKVWYDSNGIVVTDTSDSSKYMPISYKIYRIPYQLVDNPDYNPEYVPEDPKNPDHPEQVSPKNRVDYPVQEVRFGDELNSTSSIGYVSTMDGFTGTLSYDTDAEKSWKAEWKDLPKYKYVVKDETPEDSSGEPSGDTTDDTPDDTEAEPIKEPVETVYTVKETVTYPGYVEVDLGENYVEVDPDTFSVTNGGTITNKQLKYSLKIVKVDANNTETGLSGAKFQLTRKFPGESGFTKFEHDSFEVDSTNANKRTGLFTVSSTEGIILEGLIPGEYQIEEKTAPNGYIITLEPFTFTLNGDGTVTPSDTSGVLVVPLPKDNNNPAGLQIGNEPGAALPSTGGHGTRLFTILGSILIAGACLLLLRRRRTI